MAYRYTPNNDIEILKLNNFFSLMRKKRTFYLYDKNGG